MTAGTISEIFLFYHYYMKDLFVFVMLKLLSRALQYIKQKKMLVTKRSNMSPISRNHHYFQYSTESMVRRTCNLWLTTRFVLVPVPCVDCSDAKLFGGFLFICFFSSTTGSSFNIPIVSFDGVFVEVPEKLSKFPDMFSGDELFTLDWILLEPMTFWSIRGGRIIVQLHWHRLNKQI